MTRRTFPSLRTFLTSTGCAVALTGVLTFVAGLACCDEPPAFGAQDRQPPDALAEQEQQVVAELVYDLNRLSRQRKYNQLDEVTRRLIAIGPPAAPQLITALSNKGPERGNVVTHVAKALGEIGDARAVAPLVALLEDDDHYLPDAVAAALAKIGAQAVDPLLARLDTPRSRGRSLAAKALGEIGDRRAAEPLMLLLSDNHMSVRSAAAAALGQLGDPRVVDPLLDALKCKHADYRAAIATALGNLGDSTAVAPLIATLADHDEQAEVDAAAAQALGKIGDKAAVEPLIAVIRGDRWRARWRAAGALGELGDPRAVMPLIESLLPAPEKEEEEKEEITAPASTDACATPTGGFGGVTAPDPYPPAALKALTLIGRRDIEPLLMALRHKNQQVRSTAASVLGDVDDPHAIESLLAALNDEQSNVRSAAAFSLCKLGDPRGVDAWFDPLRGKEAGPYATFGVMLGQCGRPVVEATIKMLDDESRLVRCAAAIALKDIGDRRAVKPLKKLMLDPRSRGSVTRSTAVEAFEKWADPRDRPFLITIIESEHDDAWTRTRAAKLLAMFGERKAYGTLIDGLTAKLGYVRTTAARGLGLLKDPRALEPLGAMLADEQYCAIAAQAIGAIGGPRATELLIEALDSGTARTEIVAALGAVGRPAVTPLIAALRDERIHVRCGAAEALNTIADRRAVPALVEALDDRHWWVPMRAETALGAIGDARAIAPLVARINTRNAREALMDIGPAALEAVIQRLEEGDDSARSAAAEVLAHYEDKQAVPALIKALDGRNHHVRMSAAYALGRIGDRRALKPLVEALADENGTVAQAAADALVLLGSPAVSPLMVLLRHGKPQHRLRAVWALHHLHDRRSVESLIDALTDEDEQETVRVVAALALGAIEDSRAVVPLLGILAHESPRVRRAAVAALGEISDPKAKEELATLLAREQDEGVRDDAEAAMRRLP